MKPTFTAVVRAVASQLPQPWTQQQVRQRLVSLGYADNRRLFDCVRAALTEMRRVNDVTAVVTFGGRVGRCWAAYTMVNRYPQVELRSHIARLATVEPAVVEPPAKLSARELAYIQFKEQIAA